MKEVVGFIFEDVYVVFLRYAVDFFPPLLTLRCTCWVLARGNGVEEPGSLGASVRCGVPGVEDVVHAWGEEPFGVHFDADAFDAHGRGSFDGAHKGVFFAHDVRAAGGKHAEGHVESGSAADSHGALPVLVGGVMNDLRVISEWFEECR